MAATDVIRWVLAGALALVWLFFAVGNASSLLNTLIRRRPTSFGLFVGGICGTASLLVCPLPGVARYAWLPPVLDVGCAPLLVYALWGLATSRKQRADTVQPDAAVPESMTVETTHFGAVAVAADSVVVMDGGTHGCVGHTLTVDAARHATWERRLDSMGDPSECAGSGSLDLGDVDGDEFALLVNALWEFAAEPPAPPSGEMDLDVPRYVWGVVLRRGGELRTLAGPPLGQPWDDPPPAVAATLDWMRARVGAWCEAASYAPRR